MNYVYLNNNALGLYKNDCVVRSIALASGKTWDDTYTLLSEIAREQGTLLDDRDFVRDYLDHKYERLPYRSATVGEIAGMYPNNVILITMDGHITCSKYGIIYDSFDCTSQKAENAWLVR